MYGLSKSFEKKKQKTKKPTKFNNINIAFIKYKYNNISNSFFAYLAFVK